MMIFTFSITRHNFHGSSFGQLLNVAKFNITQQERPDIVAESVGVEFTSLLIPTQTNC